MKKITYLLGYAADVAGAYPGSAQGPQVLKQSPYLSDQQNLQWGELIEPDYSLASKPQMVAEACKQLGTQVADLVSEKKFFIVLGGDHSSAIGTWSGVAKAIDNPVGLIWIDAHMDSHTPLTTPSGNIHGMPLACLLGYGSAALTHLLTSYPKVKPENVCLIGVRSFETGEAELLEQLKVRIFFMDEIESRGLDSVMQEAIEIATKNTKGFGITIDIDSIDPAEAPGTGVAEENGLKGKELCQAIRQAAKLPSFIGGEIVEFDPTRDKNQITEKLIVNLITAMTGETAS